MRNLKPIKILDVSIEEKDMPLVNLSEVARRCKLPQPTIWLHIYYNRKKHRKIIRDTIVKLYPNIVKFNSKIKSIKTAA